MFFATLMLPRASSLCFSVTKYMLFSKPVDKVGGGDVIDPYHSRFTG